MFTAALFTVARSWKQPKCPSTDEWIKKMWYIHTMEYYSAIKRNKIGSSVETWMHLGTVIQSEVSQKEKNKYRILMHGGTSKMVQMNRFAGQKLRHRSREKMYGHRGFPGGAVVESLPANAGDKLSSFRLGKEQNWASSASSLILASSLSS